MKKLLRTSPIFIILLATSIVSGSGPSKSASPPSRASTPESRTPLVDDPLDFSHEEVMREVQTERAQAAQAQKERAASQAEIARIISNDVELAQRPSRTTARSFPDGDQAETRGEPSFQGMSDAELEASIKEGAAAPDTPTGEPTRQKSFALLEKSKTGLFPATNFKDINDKIVFKRKALKEGEKPTTSPADFDPQPADTIIFVDLDDTFLAHEGRKTGTQVLLEPSSVNYIKRWQGAGYKIAFLTSRAEEERNTTEQNLKTVGVNPEWKIPLFITGGQKKGEWLKENQGDFLKQYTTIVHIDDKEHQLRSVEALCEELKKTCLLVHFGQKVDFIFPERADLPDSMEGFDLKQARGGNQSTFILSKDSANQFVLKKEAINEDGTKRTAQFKEEIMADALYEAIGEKEPHFSIHVPAFKVLYQGGKYNRLSEYLLGAALTIRSDTDVAKGFIVDAFLANWDISAPGNILVSNNLIYRLDNGGSLRYRAMGELKSTRGYNFKEAISDLETLRSKEKNANSEILYRTLTTKDILTQIEKLVPLKDVIIQTADKWNEKLDLPNYAELRSNLITRLDSLKEHYYDHPQVLTRYERAHPFRMVAPGKSSASALIYSMVDGKPKILLGKRVGHEWWGNFGGEADAADQTLLNAALREVKEESMAEYDFLKEELLKAPSHDLLKGEENSGALHRMYLVKADYKEESLFKEKLKKQTDEHSKEYTNFKWVDVADILKVIEVNLTTANVKDEAQYKINDNVALHHPLMDMLRQEPVLNWLRALNTNQPVRIVNTQGSLGAKSPPPETKMIKRYDKQGEEISVNVFTTPYPLPTFFDPRSEQLEKLHKLTTSHMETLTEINKLPKVNLIEPTKKHNKTSGREVVKDIGEENATKLLKQEKDARTEELKQLSASIVGLRNQLATPTTLLPQTTATDAYLRFSLGEDYTEGNDQVNVQNFLGKYSKKYANEFSESSSPCTGAENFKCAVLQALQEERVMKNWFVFYHAVPSNISFLYDIFSEFRNVLRLKGSENIHSLRALDNFAKNIETVDAFLQDELKTQTTDFPNIDDTQASYKNRGVCLNIQLFGNPDQRNALESSFDMFHENSTVEPPELLPLLQKFLSEFNVRNPEKYLLLYNKYFPSSIHKSVNSTLHLLQIFINPDIVDESVYFSHAWGTGILQTFSEQKSKLSPSSFLIKLRKDPLEAVQELAEYEKTLTHTRFFTAGLGYLQARLYVNPRYMSDASKVRINRHYKEAFDEKKYNQELKELVRKDLLDWVQQDQELEKDTLENPSEEGITQSLPPLQKMYRHIRQSEGKESQVTSFSNHKYLKMLENDDIEGIKGILSKKPDFNVLADFEIHNDDYGQDLSYVTPIDYIVKNTKLRNFLKNKLVKYGLIILENDQDIADFKNIFKVSPIHTIYVYGSIKDLDLIGLNTLEHIHFLETAKVETFVLPNSSLSEILLEGELGHVDLSKARHLTGVEFSTNTKIGTLILPSALNLKKLTVKGKAVNNLDLRQTKSLEEISIEAPIEAIQWPADLLPLKVLSFVCENNLGELDLWTAQNLGKINFHPGVYISKLILPNSAYLRKITLLGDIAKADLSRAKMLQEVNIDAGVQDLQLPVLSKMTSLKINNSEAVFLLDLSQEYALVKLELGAKSQIGRLIFPSSPSLNEVVLNGSIGEADLTQATALKKMVLSGEVKKLTLPKPFSSLVDLEIWDGTYPLLDLTSATGLTSLKMGGVSRNKIGGRRPKIQIGKLITPINLSKLKFKGNIEEADLRASINLTQLSFLFLESIKKVVLPLSLKELRTEQTEIGLLDCSHCRNLEVIQRYGKYSKLKRTVLPSSKKTLGDSLVQKALTEKHPFTVEYVE